MGEVTSLQHKVLWWRECRWPFQSVFESLGAEDARWRTPSDEERTHPTAWASGCEAASHPARSPFDNACTCLCCLANRHVHESTRLLSVLLSAVLQVYKGDEVLSNELALVVSLRELKRTETSTCNRVTSQRYLRLSRSDATGTHGLSACFKRVNRVVTLRRNENTWGARLAGCRRCRQDGKMSRVSSLQECCTERQ